MAGEREAEIVLVRAIEETQPEAIGPEALVDAAAAAGELEEERAWLGRRAAWLLEHDAARFRPLLTLREAFAPGLALVLGVPLVLGIATNYLGPTRQIHVLYNPIAALIAWNLAVYALAGARGALRPSLPLPNVATRRTPRPSAPKAARARLRREPGLLGRLLLRRIVPGLWLRAHHAAAETREQAEELARVGRGFWQRWLEAAGPLFATRTRRLLHTAAVGLALGAVAGMFVRGLFFEYRMVWRSTFVEDPHTVAQLLRVALGPAAALRGRPLPDESAARTLMGPDGAPAAEWIWLWALAAALFVVAPRTLLALRAAWRERRIGSLLDLRLEAPYYQRVVEEARSLQVERVAEAIRTDVRIESGKFSEALAIFVGTRLYDERIVPRLARFREEGGRLTQLEADVRQECEGFQDELSAYVPVAQREFERSLSRAIERTLGVRLPVDSAADRGLASRAGELAEGSTRAAADPLEREFANTLAATVATAVAAVTGTVSGGFGHALGTAVLVGLLHTTGPVAFLIGALGGLVLAVGALWLGRGRVTGGVKQVHLPAALVRLTLREARFARLVAEGRERCRARVRELMDAELEPLAPAIAARIWTQVRPILAEKQTRP